MLKRSVAAIDSNNNMCNCLFNLSTKQESSFHDVSVGSKNLLSLYTSKSLLVKSSVQVYICCIECVGKQFLCAGASYNCGPYCGSASLLVSADTGNICKSELE